VVIVTVSREDAAASAAAGSARTAIRLLAATGTAAAGDLDAYFTLVREVQDLHVAERPDLL